MTKRTELLLNQNDTENILRNAYDVDPENVRIHVKLAEQNPARFDIQASVRLEDEEE